MGIPEGHAACVSSGTAALYLALWALGAKSKNVAIPAYVCSSLRHAVSLAGATEVLVDIEANGPNINIEELNAKAPDFAIVPHMFGLPANISNIDPHITIIEDCAQSLGASISGIPTGLRGEVGIFSFYATKLITSGGQGGMVVSKKKKIIELIKDYREFDCRHDRKIRFNFQITDLQAAVGREQLKKLPSFLQARENIFQKYKRSGFDLLDDQKCEPVRYRAVLKTNRSKNIIGSLYKAHIKSIVPIDDWELLERLPHSLNLAGHTVSLPIYPSLRDSEQTKIIKEIQAL